MTPDLTISRVPQSDCTVGVLNSPHGHFRCFSLELPYRSNQPNISCIPPGTYSAHKRTSSKNGAVIELENVVGRTYIQIHGGNYTSDVAGCILVGKTLADINGDGIPDVTSSRDTLDALLALLPDKMIITIE